MAAVFAGRPPALAGQCVGGAAEAADLSRDRGRTIWGRCGGNAAPALPGGGPPLFAGAGGHGLRAAAGGAGLGAVPPSGLVAGFLPLVQLLPAAPAPFPCPSTQAPSPSSSGWSRRWPPSGGWPRPCGRGGPGAGRRIDKRESAVRNRFSQRFFAVPAPPCCRGSHHRSLCTKGGRRRKGGTGLGADGARPAPDLPSAHAPRPAAPRRGRPRAPRSTGSPDCGFQWEWSCLMSPIR